MATIYVGHHIIDVEETADEIDAMVQSEDVDDDRWFFAMWKFSWIAESSVGYEAHEADKVLILTDAKEGRKLRVPVGDLVVWSD